MEYVVVLRVIKEHVVEDEKPLAVREEVCALPVAAQDVRVQIARRAVGQVGERRAQSVFKRIAPAGVRGHGDALAVEARVEPEDEGRAGVGAVHLEIADIRRLLNPGQVLVCEEAEALDLGPGRGVEGDEGYALAVEDAREDKRAVPAEVEPDALPVLAEVEHALYRGEVELEPRAEGLAPHAPDAPAAAGQLAPVQELARLLAAQGDGEVEPLARGEACAGHGGRLRAVRLGAEALLDEKALARQLILRV